MIKQKATFTLSMDKRGELCEWIKRLQMSDGYCSNLKNIMDSKDAKLNNTKSHGFHVFMEILLPITFGSLLDNVLKILIKIS